MSVEFFMNEITFLYCFHGKKHGGRGENEKKNHLNNRNVKKMK